MLRPKPKAAKPQDNEVDTSQKLSYILNSYDPLNKLYNAPLYNRQVISPLKEFRLEPLAPKPF